MTSTQSVTTLESLYPSHQKLLCWKSVIAGVFISIMSYLLLSALGAGLGGSLAESAVNNEQGGSALATGAGLWMGLSAVISLFLGSYFTLRISRFSTPKVGAAHGFVVASVFFVLLVWGAGTAIGGATKGVASIVQTLGSGTASLSANPDFQDVVQKAMGTSQLKSDPKEVAQGLLVRLVQGNYDSAKSYLAYQTGLSDADVDARITQLKADFQKAAKQAGEVTARAVSDAGWSLFVLFFVGLLAALVGGRIGAQSNESRPLAKTLSNQRGSAVPYIIGWLLGVPGSILILIFIVRNIF